ncbi:SOS response-associated peptidase [Pararobbsia alpina]|uniref:Abasic site processing protein n=1 Tax=Pararobbsia alpina TaxID=621374 RepID=A0A6S7BBA3_9BURK|nr:SOS response-associated peptidase [Pararobbsia alpina]CAB3794365.1 SOS response-associated protein YedK [Pararobbsia alpina]
MCGRIAQYRDARDYARAIGFASPVLMFDPADRRPGFNLAPGAHPLVMFPDQTIRTIRWGYRPAWATRQHLPQAINARSDSAAASGYFRELWRYGRVIVPADGWYEWRTESTVAQPYYIYRHSRFPMLLAGLSSVRDALEHQPGDGCVIVTVARSGGLVDVHAHRPLVFDDDTARRWLDTSLGAAELNVLALQASSERNDLAFHRVSQDVNRVAHDEAGLIETID